MFRKLFSLGLLSMLLLTACSIGATATPASSVPLVEDDFAVIAEGRLRPAQFVNLSFLSGGQIGEVLKAEGDSVAAGEVIARLENSEALQAEIDRAGLEVLNAQQNLQTLKDSAPVAAAQAQLAVAQAQDALEKAQRKLNYIVAPDVDYYQDQVDRATDILTTAEKNASITDLATALRKANEALEDATKVLNEYKNLNKTYPGGYTDELKDAQRAYDDAYENVQNIQLRYDQAQIGDTNAVKDAQDALEDAQKNLNAALANPDAIKLALAQADVAAAKAALTDAQAKAAKLQEGVDPDKLALAQTQLKTAQAALTAAQAARANAELRAPFAGTLADLNLKAGEQVTPGAPVAVLADFSSWIVETDNLTEIEVVKIKLAQGATVVLDALPDEPLRGTVTHINSLFEEKRGDITYTILIVLTDTTPLMRWGMTAEVTFDK